ncbi:unnamed protein product, partial [Taenia asiatica]|uniref:Ig-like domain-containing protein n=1 Tax=Taenia asiatica TaxID=60517 RepID=A0A0R3WAC3_TAEAS
CPFVCSKDRRHTTSFSVFASVAEAVRIQIKTHFHHALTILTPYLLMYPPPTKLPCEPVPIRMTHECRYTGVQTGSHTSMTLKCQASGDTPAITEALLAIVLWQKKQHLGYCRGKQVIHIYQKITHFIH